MHGMSLSDSWQIAQLSLTADTDTLSDLLDPTAVATGGPMHNGPIAKEVQRGPPPMGLCNAPVVTANGDRLARGVDGDGTPPP